MVPFIKSTSKIVMFLKGKAFTITQEDPRHETLELLIHEGASEDRLFEFLDTKTNVQQVIKQYGFHLDEFNTLYLDDVKVPEDIALVIKGFHDIYGDYENEDSKPIVNFVKNLIQNPNFENLTDVYSFLQKGKLPITEDGCFLAYKVVAKDFKDKYTKTMDNSPGTVVSMPRESCNLNRDETCSYGLHFCSSSYISSYISSQDVIVEVKVNPMDVTSIPVDYDQAKGRCCKYLVTNVINQGDLDGVKVKSTPKQEEFQVTEETEEQIKEGGWEGDEQPVAVPGKTCSKCKTWKMYSDFPKDKSRKDGHHSWCKACKNSKGA